MRFYIIDDDPAMVDVLEDVIIDKELGEVAGTETDPEIAIEDILRLKPDIVLADFMMKGIDGIGLVSRVRSSDPGISFVMISKVTDKSIIHRAYDAGVEFFISKPVSLIEIERVLSNVAERRRMSEMMNSIRSMFDNSHIVQPLYRGSQPEQSALRTDQRQRVLPDDDMQDSGPGNIDILLSEIGILGESGVRDIRCICRLADANGGIYSKKILAMAAEESGDSVRNIEQRVRRAIRKGLANCAKAGLEDIGSDKFAVYANYVYDYTSLREEMNFITGRSSAGGRISIPRFIEGLLLYKRNL